MVIFGLFHFINASAMAGMVPIPGGVFWIYLAELSLILAGVSIIIPDIQNLQADCYLPAANKSKLGRQSYSGISLPFISHRLNRLLIRLRIFLRF